MEEEKGQEVEAKEEEDETEVQVEENTAVWYSWWRLFQHESHHSLFYNVSDLDNQHYEGQVEEEEGQEAEA